MGAPPRDPGTQSVAPPSSHLHPSAPSPPSLRQTRGLHQATGLGPDPLPRSLCAPLV